MAIQAYTVLSEFRFNIGGALAESEKLQGAVDGISNSVGNAMDSISRMGIGFVQNLSGGQAGLLGLLGNAINASDKFTDSQLSFSSIIDSNMEHLTGSIHGLNQQMATSKVIMNDIAKDASKFGVPAGELLAMTKGLSAMLVHKGLAGENFSAARTMSRNLLKSAPNLGIDPAEVQGQLLRSIEGSASMGDTLFRRLLTEAPEPFKEAKIKDAKGFNQLDAAKKFDILNRSLSKFASNAGILELRANTLGGIMQRLKDLFSGFNSILKPLGDVLLPFLVQVFNLAIHWLETKGRELVKVMANFLKPFLEDPKELLIQAQQVRSLGGNLKTATALTGLTVFLMEIAHIIPFLKKIPFVGKIFGFITEIPLLKTMMTGIGGLFTGLGKVLVFLWPLIKIALWGLLEFAAGIAAFLIPLQGLARAIARMEIETMAWVAENIASLSQTFLDLKNSLSILFMPIMDMIKGFEELFFAVIGGTYILDFLKSALEGVSELLKNVTGLFAELYAGFRGLVAGMFDVVFRTLENLGIIINNLMEGNFSNLFEGTSNIFSGYMAAGAEEFTKTMNRALAPNVDEGGVDNAKVSNMVNNYDVKMQNNFKEVLQPDRIAFTIKDQLEKSSRNRTSTAAASIGGKMAGTI